MKIKEEIIDKVAVIRVSGKMMGGPENQEFHEHIKGLITDGISNIVADLSKVTLMNSMGLGVLMASFGTVARKGGALKLSGVTEKIKSILMITQIITFFETFESVDEAVASFKK